jgi:uncharacterized GH25 family protein
MQYSFPKLIGSLSLLLALSIATPAGAHDYWLSLDSSASIRAGTDAEIRMWLGDKIARAEEDDYSSKKAKQFLHVSAAGTTDLTKTAKNGAMPVTVLSELPEGGHLVAMIRAYSHITLPGWKFRRYLNHEDFDEVSGARKTAGDSWAEGRERYSRYMKTLVQVGTKKDPTFGAVLGQKYEIVPLEDPMAVPAGGSLGIQVLFEGTPAADVRVVARSVEFGNVEARTDASGQVRLTLEGRGEWLIRSVFMQACGCDRADWESFWASYHFIQY